MHKHPVFSSPAPDSEPDRLMGHNPDPFTPPRRQRTLNPSSGGPLLEAADLNMDYLPDHLVGARRSILRTLGHHLSSPWSITNSQPRSHTKAVPSPSPPTSTIGSLQRRIAGLQHENSSLNKEKIALEALVVDRDGHIADRDRRIADKEAMISWWMAHAHAVYVQLGQAQEQLTAFQDVQRALIHAETTADCRSIILEGKDRLHQEYRMASEKEKESLQQELIAARATIRRILTETTNTM